MSNQITIDKLTLAEKIQLMEELWADISGSPEYSLPEWHSKELARRKEAVSEGKELYLDWNQAKKEIRKEIS